MRIFGDEIKVSLEARGEIIELQDVELEYGSGIVRGIALCHAEFDELELNDEFDTVVTGVSCDYTIDVMGKVSLLDEPALLSYSITDIQAECDHISSSVDEKDLIPFYNVRINESLEQFGHLQLLLS